MKRWFVDANVFLRVLTEDDEGQCQKARSLFEEAAAGRVELVTGSPVLFELAWTLRSRYEKPPREILQIIESVLGTPGVQVADAVRVREAIDLARQCKGEFPDAYVAAMSSATGCHGVATFNARDFKRLGVLAWP
jgi:predicted nucleic-acid-binding protein